MAGWCIFCSKCAKYSEWSGTWGGRVPCVIMIISIIIIIIIIIVLTTVLLLLCCYCRGIVVVGGGALRLLLSRTLSYSWGYQSQHQLHSDHKSLWIGEEECEKRQFFFSEWMNCFTKKRRKGWLFYIFLVLWAWVVYCYALLIFAWRWWCAVGWRKWVVLSWNELFSKQCFDNDDMWCASGGSRR